MKKIRKTIDYFILGLKTIFLNPYFIITMPILILFFVSITVYKAVSLRNKIDNIENNIENKLETAIKIEYPLVDNKEEQGVNSIVNCLKKPLTENELNERMTSISKELENIFNSSYYNFSFKYQDIYTKFSMSYNASQSIFAASTVKAPEAIYIYNKAEKEETDLEEKLTYTSRYYSGGTGVLKNTPFNVDYTIKQLVSYSIIYSDNAAHIMLNQKYQSSNIRTYWNSLGAENLFTNSDPWGNISSNDATIVMTELYNYYTSDNKYANDLIEDFLSAWKIITIPNKEIKIANKTGWSDSALHDMALILDENPYTLVILTNRGYIEYQSFFNQVSNLIYEFHKEYWNEKINNCTKK